MSQQVIVGLGNPGDEYKTTRHNAGRILVTECALHFEFSAWQEEKKPAFLSAKGTLSGKKTTLVLPNTFMNSSGRAVAHFIKSKKDVGKLTVIYDDLDLPFGTIRIAHGRSSGGHNGVESIIKALKTRDFVRIRVGVSRKNTKGRAVKPVGEEKVLAFLLGNFTPAELTELKKIGRRVREALALLVSDGHQAAMTAFN